MNHNGAVHELLIDFEKAYDSVSREAHILQYSHRN